MMKGGENNENPVNPVPDNQRNKLDYGYCVENHAETISSRANSAEFYNGIHRDMSAFCACYICLSDSKQVLIALSGKIR